MKFNNEYWTKKEYNELIKYLKEISDEKYKQLNERTIPGINNTLGIQIPKLRVIAKEIATSNYNQFLYLNENNYYEETMIHGLVIGYVKEDYTSTIKLIKEFLPNITNWALCDSFCTNFKGINKNKIEFLNFLKECIKTDKEFYIRFTVIMLKVMYIDEEYIDTTLNILDNIYSEGYYVKMGVAWTLCDCFIKFEDKTMSYLNLNKLDNITYNKTLQKIIESNRVDIETKKLIRNMKRSNKK